MFSYLFIQISKWIFLDSGVEVGEILVDLMKNNDPRQLERGDRHLFFTHLQEVQSSVAGKPFSVVFKKPGVLEANALSWINLGLSLLPGICFLHYSSCALQNDLCSLHLQINDILNCFNIYYRTICLKVWIEFL